MCFDLRVNLDIFYLFRINMEKRDFGCLWTYVHVLLLTLLFFMVRANGTSETLTHLPGHLKPFGAGGPSSPIDEIEMFPNPRHFFDNYVKKLKPLKMKGAAKFSKAFKKWTDDYFLSFEEADSSMISVETKKKENRKQRVDRISFRDFLKMYNNTEHYMVDSVPSFIA